MHYVTSGHAQYASQTPPPYPLHTGDPLTICTICHIVRTICIWDHTFLFGSSSTLLKYLKRVLEQKSENLGYLKRVLRVPKKGTRDLHMFENSEKIWDRKFGQKIDVLGVFRTSGNRSCFLILLLNI